MVGERDLINFLVGLKTWFWAFSLRP